MSLSPCFRFLRPSLRRDISSSRKAAYLQFYSAAKLYNFDHAGQLEYTHSRGFKTSPKRQEQDDGESGSQPSVLSIPPSLPENRREDIQRRVRELQVARALEYPRVKHDKHVITCLEFRTRYAALRTDESRPKDTVILHGRIHSSRIAGSKLAFVDLIQDGHRVQGLCNLGILQEQGVTPEQFKDFYHLARRGDIISLTGYPSRTKRGELSITATSLPQILTPSLASHPKVLDDRETRIRTRHADLLINRRTVDTIRLRSHVIQYLRSFLLADSFLEVQTPILADSAGGAIARPFTTSSTEFPSKNLALRIAPEIWLKRLVIGGLNRVFEIGPAFRNEGLDATHNPEFTTCEFYKAYADLNELIHMTEALITGLVTHVNTLIDERFFSLVPLNIEAYTRPFKKIDFVPAIEAAIGWELPNLSHPDATVQLQKLFRDISLPLPKQPTLPRLLDKLAATYIEPLCQEPTFIIHHPASLSPLAKSFMDPQTGQIVSARVELFIQGREIANMYEEENSPFEQRRKFVEQMSVAMARGSGGKTGEEHPIDESYIEALEWGLPPTGGWGAGVDRLCMLFSGAERISDVLAFGSLRNVVGLGKKNRS